MSITITTVERIGEVAADPAAVANSGFVYTKDVAGITQLFYEADDGTVSQLTPTSGSTPWQRTGTMYSSLRAAPIARQSRRTVSRSRACLATFIYRIRMSPMTRP